MSDPKRESAAGAAYIEAALEEQIGGAKPKDLSASIMAAAARRNGSAGWNRWLVAALVLLGLAVLPAIYFVQRPVTQQAQEPQGVEAPLVLPTSLDEFGTLVAETEAVSVYAAQAFGLPMVVAGEAPVRELRVLGPGAMPEFTAGAAVPDAAARVLETLVQELETAAAEADVDRAAGLTPLDLGAAISPRRRFGHEPEVAIVLYLKDGRRLEVGWAQGRDPGGVMQTTLAVRGLGYIPPSPELTRTLTPLLTFANVMTRMERGVYRGDELGSESRRVRAAQRLRLHDAMPVQLRNLNGAAVEELDLRWSPDLHTEEGLAVIAQLGTVRRLTLRSDLLTDAGMQALAPMRALTGLVACGADEDPGAGRMRPVAKLGDGSAAALEQLAELRVLVLPGAQVGDDALVRLARALPHLERLALVGNRATGDAGVRAVAGIPGLRRLDLAGVCDHGGAGVRVRITAAALEELAVASGLTELDLSGWFAVRDGAAGSYATPDPEGTDDPFHLDARWRSALTKVAQLPQLGTLILRENPDLRAVDLAGLRSAPNLRRLDLRGGVSLTRAELLSLQAAMPRCEVLSERLATSPLEMRIVASESYDFGGVSFDLDVEKQRLQTWLARGANWQRLRQEISVIDEFNALSPASGGPLAGSNLQWAVHLVRPDLTDATRWEPVMRQHRLPTIVDPRPGAAAPKSVDDVLLELMPLNHHEMSFTGEHIAEASATVEGGTGRPAVAYLMHPEWATAYADWSEKYTRQFCAIVIDGVVRTVPMFISRVPGRGIITGNFTEVEVRELAAALDGKK